MHGAVENLKRESSTTSMKLKSLRIVDLTYKQVIAKTNDRLEDPVTHDNTN